MYRPSPCDDLPNYISHLSTLDPRRMHNRNLARPSTQIKRRKLYFVRRRCFWIMNRFETVLFPINSIKQLIPRCNRFRLPFRFAFTPIRPRLLSSLHDPC